MRLDENERRQVGRRSSIVACGIAQKVIDGADRFDPRKPTTGDDDRQECAPELRVLFELRAFQQRDQPVAEEQCVVDRPHTMGVSTQPGRKARLGAGRNQQVIEVNRARSALEAIDRGDAARVEVDRRGLRLEKLNTPQDLADRHDDRARVQASRCDFVQHRCEDQEVLGVDEQHFDAWITGYRAVQLKRRIQSAEAGAKDQDAFAWRGVHRVLSRKNQLK